MVAVDPDHAGTKKRKEAHERQRQPVSRRALREHAAALEAFIEARRAWQDFFEGLSGLGKAPSEPETGGPSGSGKRG